MHWCPCVPVTIGDCIWNYPAGNNEGDHMYVRASDACNQLAMTQNAAVTYTRDWSIRIDQVCLVNEEVFIVDVHNIARSQK